MKFLEGMDPEKRKKLIETCGILLGILILLLILPQFWCNEEAEEMLEEIQNLEVTVGDSTVGTTTPPGETDTSSLAPSETRYFRIAGDYLAGKGGDSAKSVHPPPDPVTAEPTGCNVERASVDWDYDATEDLYLMPLMAMEGMEKRPIWIVSCTYSGSPSYTEVYIDGTNDKIADWRIDQM